MASIILYVALVCNSTCYWFKSSPDLLMLSLNHVKTLKPTLNQRWLETVLVRTLNHSDLTQCYEILVRPVN